MKEDIKPIIEKVITELRSVGGSSDVTYLKVWKEYIRDWRKIIDFLKHYGLIDINLHEGIITLTKYGWQFESFDKELKERQFQENLIQTSLTTNVSIQSLNNNTNDFYKIQKRFSWAIAIATIVSAIATACSFYFRDYKTPEPSQLDRLTQVEKSMKQLDSTLQYQIKSQPSRLKEAKDSFPK